MILCQPRPAIASTSEHRRSPERHRCASHPSSRHPIQTISTTLKAFVASILLSDAGSSFRRTGRASAPSSTASRPNPGSSFSVQRGYKASYDDSSDSYTRRSQTRAGSDHPRICSAMRSATRFASDISFNSISGDGPYFLSRRASIDTVRSSEFGEDGRWGTSLGVSRRRRGERIC